MRPCRPHITRNREDRHGRLASVILRNYYLPHQLQLYVHECAMVLVDEFKHRVTRFFFCFVQTRCPDRLIKRPPLRRSGFCGVVTLYPFSPESASLCEDTEGIFNHTAGTSVILSPGPQGLKWDSLVKDDSQRFFAWQNSSGD